MAKSKADKADKASEQATSDAAPRFRATPDDHDLVFPRIVYRGTADVLGTGQIGETKRVNDRDEWQEAKKDGWRLDRDDPKFWPKQPTGKVRVPAQEIDTDSTAGDLVNTNMIAAIGGGPHGGPGWSSPAHPMTKAERDTAVQIAEADANAADPTGAKRAGEQAERDAEAENQRQVNKRARKADQGDTPLAAPRRNALKK